MNFPGSTEVLANSYSWKFCRRVANGSRALEAWLTGTRAVTSAVRDVLEGSRTAQFVRGKIWPLLLVEDYLDSSQRIQLSTLDNSVVWTRLRRWLVAAWGRIGFLGRLFGVRGSRLLSIRFPADRREAHRQAMALLVVFLALFYSIRAILVLLIPPAAHYVGWGSGLVLGLLLAAILVQSSGR
jgi:hypothetical protein